MSEGGAATNHGSDATAGENGQDTSPFLKLWRNLRLILALGVGVALLAGGAVFFLRAAMPAVTQDRVAVRFVFPSAPSQAYPNGAPFSMQDLVSPAVVTRVYAENELEDYGLKLQEFESAISVEPYLSSYALVLEQYRQRLQNRRLSFSEVQALERQIEEALEARASRAAIVSLTVSSRIPLPAELRRKLVSDIVSEWSRFSIVDLGVLKLPEPDEQRALIDVSDRSDEPLIAVYLVAGRLSTFLQRIDTLEIYAGGQSIADIETSHTLASIRREIVSLLEYRIPALVSRMPLSASPGAEIFFERVQGRLAAAEKSANERAETYRAALGDYVQATNPVRVAPSGSGADAAASTFQVSDSVLDRIIALSTRLSNLEIERTFRQDLVSKSLEFKDRAAALQRERQLVSSLSAMLASPRGAGGGVATAEDARTELLAIVQESNQLWAAANRLTDAISAARVSHAAQLYQPLPIPENDASSVTNPVWNLYTLLVVALLSLGSMAVAAGALVAHVAIGGLFRSSASPE